ncbi:hypothetical protein TNCV_3634351 [Trichonephila clavipes]|nr:hypothetical protein TNCV_3634351 [Trichonephila clavipes]
MGKLPDLDAFDRGQIWYWDRTRDQASHDPIPIPLGYRGHKCRKHGPFNFRNSQTTFKIDSVKMSGERRLRRIILSQRSQTLTDCAKLASPYGFGSHRTTAISLLSTCHQLHVLLGQESTDTGV